MPCECVHPDQEGALVHGVQGFKDGVWHRNGTEAQAHCQHDDEDGTAAIGVPWPRHLRSEPGEARLSVWAMANPCDSTTARTYT